MESLALGRPVISTRITGIPELVVDGEHGWLVTAANRRELIDAMRRMLTAPIEALDRMGAAGRAAVEADHRVETEVERLARLFARAVEGGPVKDESGGGPGSATSEASGRAAA